VTKCLGKFNENNTVQSRAKLRNVSTSELNNMDDILSN